MFAPAATPLRDSKLVPPRLSEANGADLAELSSLREEISSAARVQRQLMGPPPLSSTVEIACIHEPCRSLSGDFYDFFEVDDGLAFAVADVSGKGAAAGMLMASLRATLRAHLEDVSDLCEVMARVNADFEHDTTASDFATLFLGVVEGQGSCLRYCAAGHEPALLIRDGKPVPLRSDGLALGILPEERYDAYSVALRPEDSLVVFTDGITEARDEAGRLFGRQRAANALRGLGPPTAHDLAESLLEQVDDFRGAEPSVDDVTLVALRVRA